MTCHIWLKFPQLKLSVEPQPRLSAHAAGSPNRLLFVQHGRPRHRDCRLRAARDSRGADQHHGRRDFKAYLYSFATGKTLPDNVDTHGMRDAFSGR